MCAIVGIYGNNDASKLASVALFAMQHRGHEACGISSGGDDDKKIYTIKGRGYVRDIFSEESFDTLKGNIAIGHNRYSTAGKDSTFDTQPIQAKYKLGEISIVHNGNLINKNYVRQRLIEEGSIFQTSMDTENLIHLIAKSSENKLKDRIIKSTKKLKGAYNFIIQSRSKLFIVRDKYGIRPLSIGKLKSGGYIVASETCCFDIVDATFIREVKPGEMLIFSSKNDDIESYELFKDIDYRPCAFEYIYFARPDSIIDGKLVYKTREAMGRLLANKSNTKADMVIPVPDSGVPAALGYSKQSGLPFELGIIRNHYVGRTFIEPTQNMRNIRVKMKLSPMKSLIKGKKIVVVDDSIVRGTTSKTIVAMLRCAGAKEIHFKVASPMIKYPCFYGIDTPTKEELINATKTKDEVCRYIGADSLSYLSIDELKDAIGRERNYSLVSFDGNYFIK
ncbi:MAG: amidophosphoribosyltransferase [Epsilonproteobacteria bacterium]|nr:MAG: amidophosphoribosyltransferase [Campylobacterota bacterium]